MKIIVSGFMGLFQTGGSTWDYVQYLLGLKLLGHEVHYIEDTELYPIYQSEGSQWDDCTQTVKQLKTAMSDFGLDGIWAYRDIATGRIFGLSENKLREICNNADVFINISYSTVWRDEYLSIPTKIFIDTDPMFTQYQYSQKLNEGGASAQLAFDYMHAHDLFFTFGLNIGNPDCRIPLLGIDWLTTNKPICIDYWALPEIKKTKFGFTTIMNWTERPDFIFEDELWGQKNKEFRKFVKLPAVSNNKFEIIMNRPKDEVTNQAIGNLTNLGWNIIDPHPLISNQSGYKNFIQSSIAEFSITKETYIKSNSGWFSERSASYLASGKPVLLQDTQWSKFLPEGVGILAIKDLETAVLAVEEVSGNYQRHSRAAREIANEYFESSKVLARILNFI